MLCVYFSVPQMVFFNKAIVLYICIFVLTINECTMAQYFIKQTKARQCCSRLKSYQLQELPIKVSVNYIANDRCAHVVCFAEKP